jgi:transposase
MEAAGHAQWFERMLAEQGHELWVGDAAQIRAGMLRKQKTDLREAFHILKMLLEGRFPRIWTPHRASGICGSYYSSGGGWFVFELR